MFLFQEPILGFIFAFNTIILYFLHSNLLQLYIAPSVSGLILDSYLSNSRLQAQVCHRNVCFFQFSAHCTYVIVCPILSIKLSWNNTSLVSFSYKNKFETVAEDRGEILKSYCPFNSLEVKMLKTVMFVKFVIIAFVICISLCSSLG